MRLGPHPHDCCCEVCIDRKERQRLYLEKLVPQLLEKKLPTISVHMHCTACGGSGLLGGAACHCMSDTLTEARLKVIATKPKVRAADLPSLAEAIVMAAEILRLRDALTRFVRAEKAWLDAKAPMEALKPGTFDDPLTDAYNHAVSILAATK